MGNEVSIVVAVSLAGSAFVAGMICGWGLYLALFAGPSGSTRHSDQDGER
jgi:hypothetical protein